MLVVSIFVCLENINELFARVKTVQRTTPVLDLYMQPHAVVIGLEVKAKCYSFRHVGDG